MGLLARVKTWVTNEKVNAADLNAEFDNILDNLTPAIVDDASANVAAMQATTDPGEVGSESLATTLTGEIERLRQLIKEITGETQWYTSPAESLSSISSAIGGGLPENRIVSGRERSASSQLIALVAAGSGNGRTVDIKGATTNFVYTVEGISYTISTDVSSAAITAAPSTNNTALVNDAGASDGENSKYFGEFGSSLTIDTAGSEITGKVGELAGFKINNGSADEYFIARVKSSTELTEVRRGYFFDDSDAPVPRLAIANNDTITLLRLSWVFATTGGAVAITNNEPRVTGDEPTSPNNGDYWFDLSEGELKWKTYNGSAFVDADATLVGVCVTDANDTLAARTFDQYKASDFKNTLELEEFDNTQVRGVNHSAEINVFATELRFEQDLPRWDMDTDLDTGVTESADTQYYFYLDEGGQPIISDLAPFCRFDEHQGLYHPYHTWRAVGQAYNDASSNLEAVISYSDLSEENIAVSSKVASSALTVRYHGVPGVKQKFRSTTVTNGDFDKGALLPGTQIVVSSGSTLGTVDATDEVLIGHLILNDGRCEAAIGKNNFGKHIVTTTAEGGAGAADSDQILYSEAARTSVPSKNVVRLESNQTTAGTWDAALTDINLADPNKDNEVYISASGSFTVPEGVNNLEFRGSGGGGGGGGGAGHSGSGEGSAGGGGGGGAPITKQSVDVVPGDSLTIAIGAGGAAGAAGASGDNGGGQGGYGGETTVTLSSDIVAYFPGGAGGGGGEAHASNGLDGSDYRHGLSIELGGNGGTSDGQRGGGGGGGCGQFDSDSDLGAGGDGSNGSSGTASNGSAGGNMAGGGGTGGTVTGTPVGGAGGASRYASGGAGGTAVGAGNKGGAGGGGGASWGAGADGGDGLEAGDTAAANSGGGGGGGGARNSVTGTGFAGGVGGSGRLYIRWRVD